MYYRGKLFFQSRWYIHTVLHLYGTAGFCNVLNGTLYAARFVPVRTSASKDNLSC